MPQYNYQAIDRSGQSVKGTFDAPSRDNAINLLAQKGQFVSDISPAEKSEKFPGPSGGIKTRKFSLPQKERAEFIRQLATALQAQLPLTTALKVVGEQNPNAKVKNFARQLEKIVQAGQSLSYAMSRFPRIFDSLHFSMIHAGESTGFMEQSMTQLADLNERELEIRDNILTAAIYPVFVLCLGLISVSIVITWIIPQIIVTLATDPALLPWPTRIILTMSGFLKRYGWLLILVILIGVKLARHWAKTNRGRYFFDKFKLRIPVLGIVLQKWAVSRFARILGTLSLSGINILDALKIVRDTLGNEVLARDIDDLARQVRTGSSLAAPLRHSANFPPLLVQIVAVGEETGKLPELLLNAAEAFDKETQAAIKRFMAIFPAVLILILTLIIGFIVAATLLPIVQLETALPGL